MRIASFRWLALVGVNAVLLCVLSFHQPTTAAPPQSVEPFANSVEQRGEMIKELKEINAQLKEQNTLLRGVIKALLVGDSKPAP